MSSLIITLLLPLLWDSLTVDAKNSNMLDQVLFIGGRDSKVVNVFGIGNSPNGNCNLIPDFPYVTLGAFGIRDADGKAMVCGGRKNPRKCYRLDRANNEWTEGPTLKRQRDDASATCIPDSGICWIFGGRSRSTTEWYNPDTDSFVLGPNMPKNSVHGLCSAYSPASGLIYLAMRRDPGETLVYSFNPDATEGEDDYFTLLATMGDERRFSACGIINAPPPDVERSVGTPVGRQAPPAVETFAVVGGGPNVDSTRRRSQFYFPTLNVWENRFPLPYAVYGAGGVQVMDNTMLLVGGGVTSDGDLVSQVYLNPVEPVNNKRRFDFQAGFTLDPPRSHPVAIAVEAEDCPCDLEAA